MNYLGTLLNMHIIFPSIFLSLSLVLPGGGSAESKHIGNRKLCGMKQRRSSDCRCTYLNQTVFTLQKKKCIFTAMKTTDITKIVM
jgi:hypothetical protein